jgi:esterase/lipase superfamily enzyme
MHEEHRQFYSAELSRPLDMLVYGTWGYPVVVIPTSMGRHFEARDFQLVAAARPHIEAGRIKLYCVDSLDRLSWYAKELHPAQRVQNHIWYDRMLSRELVPLLQRECSVDKIGIAGCSFGGYQALNFAFRHPEQVAHLFTMGAAFDIRRFLDGYYDDNVYFNNPPEFMPAAESQHFHWMNIILGTAQDDFCLASTLQMHDILNRKGIRHGLDVRSYGGHDWPVWRAQFPQFLNSI